MKGRASIYERTEARARRLLDKHDLQDWSFAWNKRKTVAGLCDYNTKTIFMSKYYPLHNSLSEINDILKHEIAHALCPGDIHGALWCETAQRIGGDRGEQCSKPHCSSFVEPPVTVFCKCSFVDYNCYKVTKRLLSSTCSACGSELTVIQLNRNMVAAKL